MQKSKIFSFFQTQKAKIKSFRQKKDVDFLDSKFNIFLEELRKIDSKLDYESELEKEKVDKDFIAKVKLDSYLPKLNRKILLPLKEKKSLCLKFFQLLSCFNFSDFKHINGNIYAELLFKMISLAAENDFCERNEFIRQIYEFRCEEANSDKVQNFIRKMLQAAKARETEDNKSEQKNTKDEESSKSTQNDFFAETENDANGIKIINGLLFQYNIDESEDLRKIFSRTSIFHFFFWTVTPFALSALGILFYSGFFDIGIFNKTANNFSDFLSLMIFSVKNYNFKIFFLPTCVFCLTFFFLLISASNFIIFFFRKQRINYLKKAISKISSVCKINEDYIYKRLLPRFGVKIKKLLQ